MHLDSRQPFICPVRIICLMLRNSVIINALMLNMQWTHSKIRVLQYIVQCISSCAQSFVVFWELHHLTFSCSRLRSFFFIVMNTNICNVELKGQYTGIVYLS